MRGDRPAACSPELTMTLLFALLATAYASVDPACEEVASGGVPEGYNEYAQNDFLLNYFALATTLSPTHAPLPHPAGSGSIGLELAVIPPLSCERRLVLSYTKTEDTNKAPVAPRPRIIFSFPKIGPVVPYAGLAYVPPVTVFGTRNVIASGEVGVGVPLDGLQLGGRFHYTLMKTVAEIATPFTEGDKPYDDFYVGSTFGVDLMAGYAVKKVVPYVAVGFTDVSTFFFIGDDDYVGNNLSPYFGPNASLGAQATFNHINIAGEFYGAFKNLNTDDLAAQLEADGLDPAGASFAGAHIYTARLRAAWVF